MRLLAVTSTALTILTINCEAQLFPWSNLKHYFDQKTKDGPGNGGVLSLPGDLTADSNSHVSSSSGQDYQGSTDDSTTAGSVSKHENHNHLHTPFPTYSTHMPQHTIDYKLKNHLSKPKPSQIRVNVDSDHRDNDNDQPFFPYRPTVKEEEIIEPVDNHRKIGSKPSKQKHLLSYNRPTSAPVLITQKPLVLLHNDDNGSNKETIQNRVSSHKAVSIMASSPQVNGDGGVMDLGIKPQQTQNPLLFITPRPTSMSTALSFDLRPTASNISKNNHNSKPKRQRPSLRPRGHYNGNIDSSSGKNGRKRLKKPNSTSLKNNNLSGSNPLFVTPAPVGVTSISPQQDLYPFARPNKGETLLVESVPSISIAITPSSINNPTGATNIRPIFIGGNSNRGNQNGAQIGLVDYLVPPKISPNFVNPHSVNTQQNKFNEEKRIENEMTRLKPPATTNVEINRPKKTVKVNVNNDVINNHNMRNHNSRVPSKQRNKFHNHKMTQTQESPQSVNNENLLKNHNNDYQHAAASHIDEQISSETGFLSSPSHHSNGERVEFQMHGQNGPKSYKFGYDTGKGHNRQFRYEERDKHGHVKGHYGYYDKDGKLQVVNYEADPETGFKANPVDMSPDQN